MKKKRSGSTKRKAKKNKVPLEKVIQREILAWLETTGLLFWRQNAGYISIGKRLITLGMAGLPDIWVIKPGGWIVALEVKRPMKSSKQSPSQIEFECKLKAAGGMYHVVRSVKEAQDALRWHGDGNKAW